MMKLSLKGITLHYVTYILIISIFISSFHQVYGAECNDSPFKFRVVKTSGKTISRKCTWVSRRISRCRLAGVSETCPSTCGSCDTCADSSLRFKFKRNIRRITRDCSWVANKLTTFRCLIDGMRDTCRETCNNCSTTGLVCPAGTANEGEEQCTDVSYSTYSPKECNVDSLTLQTISTYEYDGSVLIELLGPSSSANSNAIVITVSHGGDLKPSYIPDRQTSGEFCDPTCVVDKDSYTKEIAIHLAEQIMNNYCTIPFVVINHLHRSKLDANREIGEAAQNNTIAENAWYAFHDFVQEAQNRIESYYGTATNDNGLVGIKGLLLDVHGYAGLDWVSSDGTSDGGSPFIQWGYRLSTDSLDPNQYCSLDSRSSGTIGTLTHGRNMPGQSYECLVRGPNSLGSRLSSMAIAGTSSSSCGMGLPSYEHPSPKAHSEDEVYCNADDIPCHYYSGGYDVDVHEHLNWESKTGNMMNTIQMELPRCIRFADGTDVGRDTTHESFAYNLSIGLCSFAKDLFGGINLC